MSFPNLFEEIFTLNKAEKYLSLSEKFELLDFLLSRAGFNLTSLKSPETTIPLHYLDSLTAEEYIPQNATLLDVGAGGGFPSLPLAIARGDLKITALDSTAKKLSFISSSAARLGLDNIKTECLRAEDFAHTEKRESYGVVIARAVAELPVLCELCLPLVCPGGSFIAMKGPDGENELSSAKNAISLTGGGNARIYNKKIITPDGEVGRTVIIIEKLRHSDARFPRQYAKIKKAPL